MTKQTPHEEQIMTKQTPHEEKIMTKQTPHEEQIMTKQTPHETTDAQRKNNGKKGTTLDGQLEN